MFIHTPDPSPTYPHPGLAGCSPQHQGRPGPISQQPAVPWDNGSPDVVPSQQHHVGPHERSKCSGAIPVLLIRNSRAGVQHPCCPEPFGWFQRQLKSENQSCPSLAGLQGGGGRGSWFLRCPSSPSLQLSYAISSANYNHPGTLAPPWPCPGSALALASSSELKGTAEVVSL